MGTPDADVAGYLDTNLAALTLGTNLFQGKERAQRDGVIPHEAVFVLAAGGPRPEAYLLGGAGPELRYPGVQLITRSNPREFATGQTLARSVRDAVHHAPISGYTDAAVAETEPLYLGEDEDGRHRWSSNLELITEE